MHTLNPSKIRAAAHRAMALAALHANSSLATRLSRYNAHMAKARALDTAGGVQRLVAAVGVEQQLADFG